MMHLLESCTWIQRVETAMPARQTSGEKRESTIASRIAGAAMPGEEPTVVHPALRPLTVMVQLWYESDPTDFLCMTLNIINNEQK